MESCITIDPSKHLTLPWVNWRAKSKRQSAGILQRLWAKVFKLRVLRMEEYDTSPISTTLKKKTLNPNVFGQGQMCLMPPEIQWLSFPWFSCAQVGVGEKNPGDLTSVLLKRWQGSLTITAEGEPTNNVTFCMFISPGDLSWLLSICWSRRISSRRICISIHQSLAGQLDLQDWCVDTGPGLLSLFTNEEKNMEHCTVTVRLNW